MSQNIDDVESFFDNLDLDDDFSFGNEEKQKKEEKNNQKKVNNQDLEDLDDMFGTGKSNKEETKKEDINEEEDELGNFFNQENDEENQDEEDNEEENIKEEDELGNFFSDGEGENIEEEPELEDQQEEYTGFDSLLSDNDSGDFGFDVEEQENVISENNDDEDEEENINKYEEENDNLGFFSSQEDDEEDYENKNEYNQENDEETDLENTNDGFMNSMGFSKEEKINGKSSTLEESKRNVEWSSFNQRNENYNCRSVNDNIKKYKNNMIMMEQQNAQKYNLFARIFNSLSRERGDTFSKQKVTQSDEFKNLRLENFRDIDLTFKKFPHSMYIDLSGMILVDTSKEVNEIELGQFMFEFAGGSLFEKKGFAGIKSQFFWKGRFYLIFSSFLDSEVYYTITTRLIDNGDYDTILVGYDLLENRYIFSTIEELRHYSVVGASGSGKTVGLISLTNQYLMKNNTDIIFIEKGTDLDNYLRKCERMIYKSNVEDLRYEHIISIFTYLNMELSRRKKVFSSMKPTVNKIQEYNKRARGEGLPYMKNILLVIDEFSRLRDTLGNESKESEEFFLLQLKSLIQVARSYGIYCMLATQNPTSEGGVPSNIQLNLSTKVLGLAEGASGVKYLTHSDERAVARQGKIRMGDFLFNAEGQSGMTISRMFKVDQLLDRFIEEGYIVPKTYEEQQKIGDNIDNYSNNFMNDLIQNLMNENSDVELLQTNSLYDYGFDVNGLNRIGGIKKLSLILICNLLLQWYEKEVVTKIRETNLIPSDFDMNLEIDRSLDQEKYQQLGFIFVLVKSIYFKYLDKVIKTRKISKGEINKAKNGEDSSTESLEMYIEGIKENIVYNVNDVISKMS